MLIRRLRKAVGLIKDGGPGKLIWYIRHHYDNSAAINRMNSLAESDISISQKFSAIYDEKLWLKVHRGMNADKSVSGHGSTMTSTQTLRPELEAFLAEVDAKSFFDAPCGDLNWMSEVALPADCAYIGGDVVASLIAQLKTKYEGAAKRPNATSRRFMVFDLTKDQFPKVDAWLCRDCLQHLSLADVALVVKNALASDVDYFLLTNHYNVDINTDIATGQYRWLDLTLAPFNFPEPLLKLRDENVDGEPHYVGVWRRQDLLEALKA